MERQSKCRTVWHQPSMEASEEVEDDEEEISEEAKTKQEEEQEEEVEAEQIEQPEKIEQEIEQEEEIKQEEEIEIKQEREEEEEVDKHFIQGSPTQCRNTAVSKPAKDVIVSSSQGRVNPFKVSSSQKDPAADFKNILDNMARLPRKNTAPLGRGAPSKEKGPVIKPLACKPKSKQAAAAAFFQPRTPSSEKKTVEEKGEKTEAAPSETQSSSENSENKRPKTGFQMWLEENRSIILADNPGFEETEIIREGMGRFRMLSPEERLAWTERAKGREAGDSGEGKKRKHPEGDGQESLEQKPEENDSSAKKPKPSEQTASVKLSAFAFKES